MALDPLSAGLELATTFVQRFFPDKTAEEQAQMAGMLQQLTAQTDIDKAEAQSTDPLQHWRGGMGWVCTLAYFYNFVGQPLIVAIASISGHPLNLPSLDIGPLSTLTLGMLGLGGLHVAERMKTAS
jgi:Holin of 3TMs, for gene-transfer release